MENSANKGSRSRKRWFRGALLFASMVLAGCSEAVYDTIKLMPPPALYAAGEVDPFPNVTQSTVQEQSVMFYATDRRPSTEEDKPQYYANDRGFYLRGGSVDVRADPPFKDWEEVREASLTSEPQKKRVLRVSGVNEYGVLPVTNSNYVPGPVDEAEAASAGRNFLASVNRKLASSVQNDIFIYVHGYNVDFDYPILTAKELHHYMGYRGAFITYAWPATPNRLAYFKDLETADATRKNLRELILYLSRNTRADNIHIIGYSAGSRLAFEAVYDLTLRFPAGSKGAPRLGQLILIGSDLDRSYFVQAMDDGLLETADSVTIYMSTTDAALKMSSLVLGQDRLGQVYVGDPDETGRKIQQSLYQTENLYLIDVSQAEGSSFGNGHSYFRSSPWASSDMFVSLIYGLDARERGLVRQDPENPVWSFPSDYPDRIVNAVARNSR